MLPRLLHRGAAGLAEQGLRAGGHLRASYVSQLPGASLIELRKRPCQGCDDLGMMATKKDGNDDGHFDDEVRYHGGCQAK
eukprot:39704-Eustigmatos_ZCMA.PRE.1